MSYEATGQDISWYEDELSVRYPSIGIKITSEKAKEVICALCSEKREMIIKEFCFDTDLEKQDFCSKDLPKAFSTRNWKRRNKERRKDGYIERSFDCTPFEDQLRAYVLTDSTDCKLLQVLVQGE